MTQISRFTHARHLALGLGVVLFSLLAGPLHAWLVSGQAQLLQRSVTLSDNRPSTTSTYRFQFHMIDSATIGSIRFQFCSNSSIIDLPCTPPDGFDSSPATLSAQAGMTGFTLSAASSSNELILTRSAALAGSADSAYTFQGIQNPSVASSYFIRVEAYSSEDATGPNVEYGGLAFSIDTPVSIQTKVPPYLLFCTGTTIQPYDCATANGNYINFGDFSTQHTATGHTQLLAATNDPDGYSIYLDGTTLTSGNNIIPALANPDVSRPGTSQFGLNLRANNTPPTGDDVQGPGNSFVQPEYNTTDFYKFNSGDTIAVANTAADYRLYTASYMVNISKSQPTGVYVSTITYIGLADF